MCKSPVGSKRKKFEKSKPKPHKLRDIRSVFADKPIKIKETNRNKFKNVI